MVGARWITISCLGPGKTRRHCLVLDRNTLRLQQNAQINTEPLTGWGQGLFLYKIIREKTIDNLYIADTSWINFGSPQENSYDRYSKNNNRSISPFAVDRVRQGFRRCTNKRACSFCHLDS